MTIDDVAAALNISKATVSRAITGNGRISGETRRRVSEYMEAHNFTPNTIAQSLAKLQTQNIAFAVPSRREFGGTPFFLQCLIGVSRAAGARAYDVLVVDNELAQIRRIVERRKVDGVVLSRSVDNDVIVNYLLKIGVPFILVGSAASEAVFQIDHDHYEACKRLTAELLSRWDGAFGLLLGDKRHVVNQNRCRGFCEAIVEGRPTQAAPVRWEADGKEGVNGAFRELYAAGVRSFLCGDDTICTYLFSDPDFGRAIGARAASFYGGSVFDTFRSFVPTIRFDAEVLGERAGALLIRKISGEEVPHKTLVDYKLIL